MYMPSSHQFVSNFPWKTKQVESKLMTNSAAQSDKGRGGEHQATLRTIPRPRGNSAGQRRVNKNKAPAWPGSKYARNLNTTNYKTLAVSNSNKNICVFVLGVCLQVQPQQRYFPCGGSSKYRARPCIRICFCFAGAAEGGGGLFMAVGEGFGGGVGCFLCALEGFDLRVWPQLMWLQFEVRSPVGLV